MTTLQTTLIRTDGGTQPRSQLDIATIAEYAESMADGATFPPVVAFHDGADYWLADGFHRLAAAQQLGLADVGADVRQGTLQDAQWYSYSVNQAHGLRRSNGDKRRAVESALAHPYANRYSLREIASHCGVSKSTIENYRNTTSVQNGQIDDGLRLITRNGTAYEMDTSGIGTRPTPDYTRLQEQGALLDGEWRDRFLRDNEALGLKNIVDEETGEPLDIVPTSRPVNFSSASNEWYTPADYIEAARSVMGGIDLDPASNDYANEAVVKAAKYYTEETNGFDKPWHGYRVWLNPPYGTEEGASAAGAWAARLIEQYDIAPESTQAVLLVNAVTDRKWFQQVWRFPICFTDHRIKFYTPEGTPQQPISGNAIIYLGPNVARFVREFSRFGTVVARLTEYDGQAFCDACEVADAI